MLVSALISSHGTPAQLYDRWDEDEFELVTSIEQLEELERVLTYPRIAKRMRPGIAETTVFRLANAAVLATDLPSVDLTTDPDDNAILATAIAGRANLLVSGDRKHVLPLEQVQGIRIVSAIDALALLDKGRG